MGLIFFFTIAFSSLMIRPVPADRHPGSERGDGTESGEKQRGLTTRQIIRHPSFIGISFIHVGVACAFHTLAVHLVPYAIDKGIAPTVAAVALGLLGGSSVPARILSGFFADILGWKRILTASLFGMSLFIGWLFFLREAWMLYCFVFFYGFCHGCRTPSHLGVLGEFFGMKSLGEIIGITMALAQVLGAFAPYFAGFIFDVTSSYLAAFIVIMIILFMSGIIALAIKNPLAAE